MNIEGRLADYFKERSGIAVGPDTLLIEEKIIDSMGVVELLAFIEETFGVEVDLEDLTIENFATIKEIAGLINGKRN